MHGGEGVLPSHRQQTVKQSHNGGVVPDDRTGPLLREAKAKASPAARTKRVRAVLCVLCTVYACSGDGPSGDGLSAVRSLSPEQGFARRRGPFLMSRAKLPMFHKLLGYQSAPLSCPRHWLA
jgi:hypothetical protein